MSGPELIGLCKQHILETMRTLPECAPNGPGLRNKEIEAACGFALSLHNKMAGSLPVRLCRGTEEPAYSAL